MYIHIYIYIIYYKIYYVYLCMYIYTYKVIPCQLNKGSPSDSLKFY